MSEAYISAEELQWLNATQSLTIIDVRRDDEYQAGHIPGAIHLPADTISDSLDRIPSDRPVVTY